MRSSWIGAAAKPNDDRCLYRKRRQCDDRGWDRSNTSQGAPDWSPRKCEEARKHLPLEPSEGVWPCPHLDFRPRASRTVRESKFLSLTPPSLWYFVRAAPGTSSRCPGWSSARKGSCTAGPNLPPCCGALKPWGSASSSNLATPTRPPGSVRGEGPTWQNALLGKCWVRPLVPVPDF